MKQHAARMATRRLGAQGYALLSVLVLIFIIGLSLGQAGTLWSDSRQREREQELLKVGDHIRTAIGRYYNASPGTVKQYPPSLEALLRDDRFPTPQRYLRELYIDPITRQRDWGMLVAPSGGIMGVYSLSAQAPYKRKRFRPVDKSLEDKKMYGDWVFAYLPATDYAQPVQ